MTFFYLIPSSVLLYKERRNKTLTIAPTPADSIVKLSAKGYIQQGNAITVMKGREVEWEVSRQYYYPKSGKIVLRKNTVLPVDLEEYAHYTLTINVDHPDSDITFTSIDGAQIDGNKYWVHNGSTISYRIYKAGYFIETGSIVMDSDKTLNITLETSYNIIYLHELGDPLLVYTGQEEI